MHELYPNKIFFGGFNGGYGKMWVYNLRSEFLKHKIAIIDTKIEPWISRSKKQEQETRRTRIKRTEFNNPRNNTPFFFFLKKIHETEFFFLNWRKEFFFFKDVARSETWRHEKERKEKEGY